MSTNFISLLECPVCYDYCLPPIHQCRRGHLVCEDCRSKLSHCPMCRGPIGNIRNLAMEKIAKRILFPCKYSDCKLTLLHTNKANHEKTCKFRLYSCPHPVSCKWQGKLNQVSLHFKRSHKCISDNQSNIMHFSINLNVDGNGHLFVLQSCYTHSFLLILEKRETDDKSEHLFATVKFIGPAQKAKKFIYKMEIVTNKAKLIWKAIPHSIQENLATNDPDEFILDVPLVNLSDNGKLDININIIYTSNKH